MKVWIIRHKPTGKPMPARMFRTAASGWSFWNPYEKRPGYRPHDENPRIFFSEQAARNALAMWLQGEWKKQFSSVTYFEPSEYEGNAPSVPELERKREDMEIVAGELVL